MIADGIGCDREQGIKKSLFAGKRLKQEAAQNRMTIHF